MSIVALALSLFLAAESSSASPAPLPETEHSMIGYETVDDALTDLRKKPGVKISVQQGWTIAEDRSANTLWSFPSKDHPAYPSAVKRTIVEKGGALYVQMGVLCGASKSACDDLVKQFRELNDRMREAIKQSHENAAPQSDSSAKPTDKK